MNKYLPFLIMSMTSALAGCIITNVPKPVKPDFYFGEIQATINGVAWSGCAYAQYPPFGEPTELSLAANVLVADYYIAESLSIIHIPISPGTYALSDWRNDSVPNMHFSYRDHDVFLASYLVEEGENPKGSVTLLEIDTLSREVRGEFEGVIYLYRNYDKPGAPDSLVITDGHFHTRILE